MIRWIVGFLLVWKSKRELKKQINRILNDKVAMRKLLEEKNGK